MYAHHLVTDRDERELAGRTSRELSEDETALVGGGNKTIGLKGRQQPRVSSTQKSRKPREVNMKKAMRLSTVLALTGIASICGVSKPGIAGVSFSDIQAAYAPGRFAKLDDAFLGDRNPGVLRFKNGHAACSLADQNDKYCVRLLTFDSTNLVTDSRFTQDQMGAVSTNVDVDPTDSEFGFVFAYPQDSVTLDLVTTSPGQSVTIAWGTIDFSTTPPHEGGGSYLLKTLPPTKRIKFGPGVGGWSDTGGKAITKIHLRGSQPNGVGVDCIIFEPLAPGDCPIISNRRR
jgi:hypothetical protein